VPHDAANGENRSPRQAGHQALSHHLPRLLVLPQTEKHRMAQIAVTRPFVEFNLANNLWLQPCASSVPWAPRWALGADFHTR